MRAWGFTLLFSGQTMPLLEAYASWTGGKPVQEATHRPDVLFEDFEQGYGNWKVQGEAFGRYGRGLSFDHPSDKSSRR